MSAHSHERTRRDHATELAEDYVEAIDDIIAEKGTCRSADLVTRFQVTHATINNTVGRLARDGYVIRQPYQPITLTARGKRLAKKSRHRHQIVYEFLLKLGVSDATATVDSEGLEHHVSQETLDAMQQFMEKSR